MTTIRVEPRQRRLAITASARPLVPTVALIAGLAALVFPTTTAFVAVLLLGIYALGDGLVTIVDELAAAPTADRRGRVTVGLVSATLGGAILIWPALAQPVLVVALGLAAIMAGGWQFLVGLALRGFPAVPWPAAMLVGAALVVLGVWVILHPGSGRTIMLIGAVAVTASAVVAVGALREKTSSGQ